MARILIVEDEPDTQDLLADVLALEGFEVRSTSEATGTLGLVRRIWPDLIILDLRLPGIGGLELLRLMDSDPACRVIPVVVCSGARDVLTAHADELERRGAMVVHKPFELEELLSAVKLALANRQVWNVVRG